MKKAAIGIAMSLLALVGIVVTANPASANPGAFEKDWSRATCESGTLLSMRRLHDGSHVQGRQYVYRKNGRICAFMVDHMPGGHRMGIVMQTRYVYLTDANFYYEYAGVLTAPKKACVQISSWMHMYRGGAAREYGTTKRWFC